MDMLLIVQERLNVLLQIGLVMVSVMVKSKQFGYDLTCYENDGGDCVSVTIGDSCADGAGVIDCNEQCVSTWYVDNLVR